MDGPSVYALALDENRLFSSGSDGEIKEWDPNNGEFRQMAIVLVRELENVSTFYNPIFTAMEFSAMFTFQLDNTKI